MDSTHFLRKRNGVARVSYVAQHLSEGPLDAETEDLVKYTSYNMYAGMSF